MWVWWYQREESVTGKTEHNMACEGWIVTKAIRANPYFSAVPHPPPALWSLLSGKACPFIPHSFSPGSGQAGQLTRVHWTKSSLHPVRLLPSWGSWEACHPVYARTSLKTEFQHPQEGLHSTPFIDFLPFPHLDSPYPSWCILLLSLKLNTVPWNHISGVDSGKIQPR